MSEIKFVGLHAHTTFSVGDAIGYPKDHFDFAIENGMDALAITEHGNLNSAGYSLQAAEEYKKKGTPFKVLWGVEAYIHPSLEEWTKLKGSKDAGDEEVQNFIENERDSKGKHYDPINRRHHLVLVAQNSQGLENIFRMVSRSYREGFYRYPRIDFEMLQNHNEGVIASTACLAGLPSWIILREHANGEEAVLKALNNELLPLLETFGKDRIFLELQFNRLPEQKIVNDYLIKFSKESGYSLIAAADSHYARPQWWRDREVYRLLAQQSKGWNVSKEDLPKEIDELKCELYPKNGEQMFASYLEMYGFDSPYDQLVVDAIQRTHDIAHNNIDEIIPDGSFKLPVPKGYKSPFERLTQLCIEGMEKRGFDKKDEYVERLATELKVVQEKDFALYFTTLYDAMNALRKRILIGPARGSGAGSLICYLLDITQLDPIKHNLLFERFLSKARKEAPDIDTDVEDKDICLEALKEEFGEHRVIPVSNFNTLQLKSLVKDISKFYDIPFTEVNDVTTKMEDEARPKILEEIGHDQKLYTFDLEGAKKHSPTFQEFLAKYPHVSEHIEVLFKQIKSIGRHAGGVIICEDSESCMPVIRSGKVDQTPWTEGMAARHLERFGLIKYDFLGIATLRFIRRTIELILKKQGIANPTTEQVYEFYNTYLHPDRMNLSDKKVFEYVYQQGRFPGIFQFTEKNAQNFCKRAAPTCVGDIAAITSIYRPGPLHGGVDKLYVEASRNKDDIVYDHPILEEVLGETFGYIVYQEQFMLLAHKLAGFTLDESDKLRKLLMKPVTSLADDIKKEREEIAKRFIDGCISVGLKRERAEHLWEKEILGFISYGFNKSHAMSYAFISYQCAWLFTYHESEWVRAYLELDPDRDKAIEDVSSVGYRIGKPNVLRSGLDWELDGNTLIPSLTNIKGIGEAAVHELIEVRNSVSEFDDLYKFFYKTEEKKYKNGNIKFKNKWRFSKFNKRALDALIKLEAFDDFEVVGYGRLFETYAHMHRVIIGNYDKIKRGNIYFHEIAKETPADDWDNAEKVEFQQYLLGTYDKELILEEETLKFFSDNDINPLDCLNENVQYIWFIVKDIQKKTSKTGKSYIQLNISDGLNLTRKINYFGEPPDEGIKKNKLYVAPMFIKNGWLNVPYGEKILCVSR